MFLFSISALFGSSKVRVISTSTLFLTIFMFYILAIQRGEFFNSQSTFTNIILSFLFINIQHEAISVLPSVVVAIKLNQTGEKSMKLARLVYTLAKTVPS